MKNGTVEVSPVRVDHHHRPRHHRRLRRRRPIEQNATNAVPLHIDDPVPMMIEKERPQILAEIDHRPEVGSTINGHIAEVDPTHEMIDVEVGAGIEMQAEEKAVVVAAVAVAAVVVIRSVDRPTNPQQTVLPQNQLNDGQTISTMKMRSDETCHGADTPTTMTKTIGTTIEWAMNRANDTASAMVRKQSDNLNKILWIHGVQSVK